MKGQKRIGIPYMTLSHAEQVTGKQGQEAMLALVGRVDKIGNPSNEEGDTWTDYPKERIIAAYLEDEANQKAMRYEVKPYVLVDTEEVEEEKTVTDVTYDEFIFVDGQNRIFQIDAWNEEEARKELPEKSRNATLVDRNEGGGSDAGYFRRK
jgi:hypothetical protein